MRLWRICVVALAATAMVPTVHVMATAPPTTATPSSGTPDSGTPDAGSGANNDLLPDSNDLGNCVGTAERPNCGSRARADGHTYLVFLALALGLGFIGWRISRGVRAGGKANEPAP